MNKNEIKNRFNYLRVKYGDLLIKLKRENIPSNKWNKYIFSEFNEEEILFIFGKNIWKFINNKNRLIDFGKGTKAIIEDRSSKLLISPGKAGILTWICTDGYMSLHSGGYYISIKDSDVLVFDYFKKLINKAYGKFNYKITKIKNKNAFQYLFCSKDIFRDIVTYIPLSSSKNWTIPIEILDEKAKKEVLRILTHTEGTIFESNRLRAIEITLANPEVLIQAQSLFKNLGVNVNPVRKDSSGGCSRYKFSITTRENLEKFRERIHFIPNTKKYEKFEKIMGNYRKYHKQNCSSILFDLVKKNKFIITKDIISMSGFERSSISRNLKQLKKIGALDYKKGPGNSKYWFAVYD